MSPITRTEIDELIDAFSEWVKDETQIEIKGEYGIIDTPFMDPLNDLIRLYLTKENGDGWILSDMGQTIQNLKMMEVNVDRVYPIIEDNIRINGVEIREGEILTEFRKNKFAQKKFDLINAIIHISDLYELRSSGRVSIFKQLVFEFFEEVQIPLTPDIRITGKSGLSYHFDFAIPKLNGTPEKLAKIVNTPTKQVIESVLFEWGDVRDLRRPGTQGLAVLNDEKRISNNLINAMKENDVIAMPWSERDGYLKRIVA